jgi:hypothetical protein
MNLKIPKSISYRGDKYTMHNGYYRSADYKFLHKEIYKHSKGEIPKGMDVHHKDHNRGNNDPSNLVLIKEVDHLRGHISPAERKHFTLKIMQKGNGHPHAKKN